MSAHAARLSRLFTPEYVKRVNAQIVHPAQSVYTNPEALEAALNEPLQLSIRDPTQDAPHLAAYLSAGIIQGRPFKAGNSATAFFIANEYIRAMAIPGFSDGGEVGAVYASASRIGQQHFDFKDGPASAEK
ncbi:hypothetical protein DFP72DRAFT_923960 [Ephemerocybe angulata]|uniref:Fido domain-containing protein n=1 Tax=Ephemerocybe angulata TaxID=980116 RepID=A0A8H6HHQ4_9AGAR|nr:hypothetical protein DFP72DRAFT_923960 [Tulosesus angulatus]